MIGYGRLIALFIAIGAPHGSVAGLDRRRIAGNRTTRQIKNQNDHLQARAGDGPLRCEAAAWPGRGATGPAGKTVSQAPRASRGQPGAGRSDRSHRMMHCAGGRAGTRIRCPELQPAESIGTILLDRSCLPASTCSPPRPTVVGTQRAGRQHDRKFIWTDEVDGCGPGDERRAVQRDLRTSRRWPWQIGRV